MYKYSMIERAYISRVSRVSSRIWSGGRWAHFMRAKLGFYRAIITILLLLLYAIDDGWWWWCSCIPETKETPSSYIYVSNSPLGDLAAICKICKICMYYVPKPDPGQQTGAYITESDWGDGEEGELRVEGRLRSSWEAPAPWLSFLYEHTHIDYV